MQSGCAGRFCEDLINAVLDAEISQCALACDLAVQDVFARILAAVRAQDGRSTAEALEAPLYYAAMSATDKDAEQQLRDLCGRITGPKGRWAIIPAYFDCHYPRHSPCISAIRSRRAFSAVTLLDIEYEC